MKGRSAIGDDLDVVDLVAKCEVIVSSLRTQVWEVERLVRSSGM